MDISQEARDNIAEIVVDRFRRAKDRRENAIIHQGSSADYLMYRASAQYRREYTPEDAVKMEKAFGFCPSRYYGVCQQKVDATLAWKMDMVIMNLDNMFTVQPTPDPSIDKETRERIRRGVRQELINKMMEVGIADPSLLVNANGEIDERLQEYLESQARLLKDVEQSRIVTTATQSAKRLRVKMRDELVEGDFRQAYSAYSFDQILYGRGVMRFPFMKMMPVRHYTKNGGITRRWEAKPTFSHVNVFDFFPIDDAANLQENTANIEKIHVTKAELINKSRDKNYYKEAIRDVLDEFSERNRNWLGFESDETDSFWGLDETIPLLIHEGYFSGSELAEMGITGVGKMDYANARVEVVGFRTIKCELIESKRGHGRSYYSSPYEKCGDGIYDAIGLGAKLFDDEQRINRLLHIYEHNIDWASRPPILTNPSSFDNPNDSFNIVPGGSYQVEETFGVTGSMPAPVRPIESVSAQYHLIMTQVNSILQMADNSSGIPAFAYSGTDYGRGSLGEYSARISNVARNLKHTTILEDIHLIEPMFTDLYERLLDEDKNLREGADINIRVRGITGLLQEDQKAKREQQVLPMSIQLAQQGVVPPEVGQYAIKRLLDSSGVPTEALGLDDPVINKAMATAAQNPLDAAVSATDNIPQVDGRSQPRQSDSLQSENLQQVSPENIPG